MAAAHSMPLAPPAPSGDQRILFHGVTWKDYLILRDVLDGPAPRMTYLRGALELMSPSPEHELWKKNIARFVEHFAFVRGIPLHGYGSTTFKKEAVERGAEPDECYLIGKPLAAYPEIVIEVVHSAPLLDKLRVYRPMGIAEVWVFERGVFQVWELAEPEGYQRRDASQLVPGLDFSTLASFVLREDTPQALSEFDRALRSEGVSER